MGKQWLVPPGENLGSFNRGHGFGVGFVQERANVKVKCFIWASETRDVEKKGKGRPRKHVRTLVWSWKDRRFRPEGHGPGRPGWSFHHPSSKKQRSQSTRGCEWQDHIHAPDRLWQERVEWLKKWKVRSKREDFPSGAVDKKTHLPMQGTWAQSLVREDSTCCGATTRLDAVLCNKRSHRREKAEHKKSSPNPLQPDKARAQQKRPSTANVNKYKRVFKTK